MTISIKEEINKITKQYEEGIIPNLDILNQQLYNLFNEKINSSNEIYKNAFDEIRDEMQTLDYKIEQLKWLN